jgi:hypothetical protein
MIILELQSSYKAKSKGHPDKPDGTESIGDFVPVIDQGDRYIARRFSRQIFSGNVEIMKADGRIYGKDGETHWYIEVDTPTLPTGYQRKCDCGGYKTYGSWDKEYHSRWCEVNT